MHELIGIGAMNLDYIATRRQLMLLEPRSSAELISNFEHGVEKSVDESEIQFVLTRIAASRFEIFLGGSAFNAIHTVAATKAGFRLGYVGVAGDTGVDDLDFCDTLETLGVDIKFILRDRNSRSGVCISLIQEGERSMLTNQGANRKMADHLANNYEDLIDYLARAKIIHLTSFFDDQTPPVILSLLTEVKERSPWLKLSFDPGYHWASRLTNDVLGIIKLTDILFLNDLEFRMLGRYVIGMSENEVAENILELCPAYSLIVLKQPHGIRLFYRIQEHLLALYFSNVTLPPDRIEDDTGAGDVFAGGFLTAALVTGMEIRDGVSLGLRLVNAKLRSAGSSSFGSFPSIFDEMIKEISNSVVNPESRSSQSP